MCITDGEGHDDTGHANSKPMPELQLESNIDVPPVWDEATGRFWFATGVNAYDIPDGDDWKLTFREAVKQHAQENQRNQHPLSDVPTACQPPRRVGSSSMDCEVLSGSPPSTPKRVRKWTVMGSPATPPFGPCTPEQERRAARVPHTKALLSMPRKAGITAMVQGRQIALYRFGGRIFAVNSGCPHQGGNLSEGEIGDVEDISGGRKCYVTCPVHKMRFDLATGAVLHGNCAPLQTYITRIGAMDLGLKIAMVEVGFDSLSTDYFEASRMIF